MIERPGPFAERVAWELYAEDLEKELQKTIKLIPGATMPEIRYYTATQQREVKIWANSAIEAAQLADEAFKDNIQEGDQSVKPHIVSPVRERGLSVREDR